MNKLYFYADGIDSSLEVRDGCSAALSTTLLYPAEHITIRVSARRRQADDMVTRWDVSFNIYAPNDEASAIDARLDVAIADPTTFGLNLHAELQKDAANVTLLDETFSMGSFGESPPDSLVTALVAEIEREEVALVGNLLGGNESKVTRTVDGITLVAQRIDTSAADNGEPVVVTTDEDVSVALPVASLADDLGMGADEDIVVVITPLSNAQTGGGVGAVDDSNSGDDGSSADDDSIDTLVASSVSINIFDENGAVYSVSGLTNPILLTLPIGDSIDDDQELECAFWDESIADWRNDGVSVSELGSGSITCATTHLSLFGAIVRGFTGAFVCSQASLLTKGGFEVLREGDWLWHFSAWTLWLGIAFFMALLAKAIHLDCKRSELWMDGAFLIPHTEKLPKQGFEDGLVTNFYNAMEILKDCRREMRDAAINASLKGSSGLGVLWASVSSVILLLARLALERVAHHNACVDIKVHYGDKYERLKEVLRLERPSMAGSDLGSATMKTLSSTSVEESRMKSSHGSIPTNRSRTNSDEEVPAKDVNDAKDAKEESSSQGSSRNPAAVFAFISEGRALEAEQPKEDAFEPKDAGDADHELRRLAGPADEGQEDHDDSPRPPSAVEPQDGLRKLAALELDKKQDTRNSHGSSQTTGACSQTPKGSGDLEMGTLPHLSSGQCSQESPTSNRRRLSSTGPESLATANSEMSSTARAAQQRRRSAAAKKLRSMTWTLPDNPAEQREQLLQHLQRLHRKHAARVEYHQSTFGQISFMPRTIAGPLLTLGPIGACLVFSIFMRSSTRVLLLICRVAGAVAVTTFFLSQDGVPSATSPGNCKSSPDIATIMGRLIAIALSSGVFAEFPVAALTHLHRRRFKTVRYDVGSDGWNWQLRKWFIFDILLWTCGLIYVAFCLLYIMLFIANVAQEHHAVWLVSAGIEVTNHMFICPLAVSVLPTVLVALVAGSLSMRHGVNRSEAVEMLLTPGNRTSATMDSRPSTEQQQKSSRADVHVILNVNQSAEIDGMQMSEEHKPTSGDHARRFSGDSTSSAESIKSNLTWI